jgi:hypothetical protein
VVKAQHRVSTLKLVDSVDEQALLEDLIEAGKPPLPPECRHLHYLLSTPFRYGAAYPAGSRFRRAGLTEGTFYAPRPGRSAVRRRYPLAIGMASGSIAIYTSHPFTPPGRHPYGHI